MIRLAFIFSFLSFLSFGQQNPQYSHFVRNQVMFNPGACGAYDFIDINLGGRGQWIGANGAPITSYLSISVPANKVGGRKINRTYGKVQRNKKRVSHPRMRTGKFIHAYGGNVLFDQYGPLQQVKLTGTYAMHFPLSRDFNLSFGLNLGLSNRSFNRLKGQVLSELMPTGVVDATYNNYVGQQANQFTMDLGAGLYFYGKGAFVGISANQLTNDLIRFGNTNIEFNPGVHLFLTGGYKIKMNRKWSVTPALLVKYIHPAPISFEVAAQFEYRERFWFGASYRYQDAIVAFLGCMVNKKFKIAYSYDINTNVFLRNSNGGHEITIGLMLGRKQKR